MNPIAIEEDIRKISELENLYSLANFDKVMFEGQNALGYLSLISKTRSNLRDGGVFDLMTHDIVNSVSSDIRFALANAYLYFPKANNFLKEIVIQPNGKRIPTYFMKIEDKRFYFYVNISFEKLYMFWDRVGDILAKSFQLDIREDKIYFGTVISKLEDKLLLSESGKWLLEFYENEYSEILNRLRIKIVHYRQKDTYFYLEWLSMVSMEKVNPDDIARLQFEKEQLLPLLKNQLHYANTGFGMMVRFIAEQGVYENDGALRAQE